MVEAPYQWQVVRAQLDPARGSEQAGERPVLIVSREILNKALSIVCVLPLTTWRAGRRVYSSEVLLPAARAGQPSDSIVMAHQVRVISRERLTSSYGWLDDEDLRGQVRAAMRLYLDLE
jgi:mRNA interferase MazF